MISQVGDERVEEASHGRGASRTHRIVQEKSSEIDAPGVRRKGNPTRIDIGRVGDDREEHGLQRVTLLDSPCAADGLGLGSLRCWSR